MIQLKVRTEYTFRKVFGPLKRMVGDCTDSAMAITDTFGTWGHVPFFDACKAKGVKPLLGVELSVVVDVNEKERYGNMMTFIAKNNEGLAELYKMCSEAFDNFYYTPRLDYETVLKYDNGNIVILSGVNMMIPYIKEFSDDFYLEANPSNYLWLQKINRLSEKYNKNIVACSNNLYPGADDKDAYRILTMGKGEEPTTVSHLATEAELRAAMPMVPDYAYAISDGIAMMCNVDLPVAENIKFIGDKNLKAICLTRKSKVDNWTEEYDERLDYELELIKEKGFIDYFLVIADLVKKAKETMLVGPSRGSSAGSLVCYLMDITEIDPIKFGLIFERFIDITRFDLPDIDIDFPDKDRQEVIHYLEDKYGKDKVAHIGTISRYKPKSIITDASKAFGIPAYEAKDLKDSIIERSGGDARAAFCLQDTFETLDTGKAFLKKYPQMSIVSKLEFHARHTGVHAAGIIICNEPVNNYCAVNSRDDVALIDKKDAEKINLLKVDILGLRTLSIIEHTIDQIPGLEYDDMYKLPLDDEKAFAVVNEQRFSGIFQFEGYALQSLCKQMKIEEFNDIVAITSLARPGPLHCGGATDFISRRIGATEVEYLHEATVPFTEETYGTIVFQEQVLNISREVGLMEWEDVNQLRKALSKSLGEEFFNKYWEKFLAGSKRNGIDEKGAKRIWDNMCTFGSWAFNKSHAVAYGMISYWCMWLKSNYPLEFGVACLNNEKEEASSIKLLRELVKEGYEYESWNMLYSGDSWGVSSGKIIGGFNNIKGIGPKVAADMVARIKAGGVLTPGQIKKLDNAVTPYDDIFPCESRFPDFYSHPENYRIKSMAPVYIRDIKQEDGMYIFMGVIKDINLRDLNEYGNIVKRGGKEIKGPSLFLNLTIEDDTDSIICTIGRFDYPKIGAAIVNRGKDKMYIVKGEIRGNWRKIYVKQIKFLDEGERPCE